MLLLIGGKGRNGNNVIFFTIVRWGTLLPYCFQMLKVCVVTVNQLCKTT